jgi:hypothetical protein
MMKARGYPMTDFDTRAADLSVDYPHVVRNYRKLTKSRCDISAVKRLPRIYAKR